MKFLLVNIACINGGVEAHFGLLARELTRRGHSVDAYFYIDGGSEYASGKHLFDGVCRYWIGPGVSLSEVLAAGRYDVVHANLRSLEWGIVDTLKRVGFAGAAVATSHGEVLPGWPSEDGRFALTAVSNHLAARLREAGYPDAAVVYNAVDLSVFNDIGPARPASRPVVVWVGRSCDADKDFTGMAAAACRLVDSGYLLWIVDGRAERGLNTLDCWLPESCEILRGLTPSEMAAVYRGAAASGGFLLSTSQNEAFGLALCEAMACGCPVAAPRVGGIPEVVEDGVSGVLYDRAGGVKDLFDKAGLLSDPDFRASIVAGGLERVRRLFAAPIMIDGYERVYEAAVSALKPGKPSFRQRAFSAAVRIRRLLRGSLERGHRPT